ncbi:MAG: hypothetical protein HRT65_11715 [Flavobacteriaceae bacterium]|nr:hypothetical protein [Flavobacteriaceae bacterium]
MKKQVLTLVFLLCMQGMVAQIERDKMLHFVGGNLYGLAGAGIAKQISDGSRFWTFAGAVGGSLLIGLGKEAIDSSQRPGGWDNDDLLATVLGGTTVGFTIDIFTNHKRNRQRRVAKSQDGQLRWYTDGIETSFQPIEWRYQRLPALNTLSLSKQLTE